MPFRSESNHPGALKQGNHAAHTAAAQINQNTNRVSTRSSTRVSLCLLATTQVAGWRTVRCIGFDARHEFFARQLKVTQPPVFHKVETKPCLSSCVLRRQCWIEHWLSMLDSRTTAALFGNDANLLKISSC
jgi:hypothetical protein